MTVEGLTIALRYGTQRAEDLEGSMATALDEARSTSEQLDDLEARLGRLPGPATDQPNSRTSTTNKAAVGRVTGTPTPIGRDWNVLVREAAADLRSRGVDPSAVDLDQLLDPEEVRRLERRHQAGFAIRADLDPYDVLAAVAAGLTATAIDALVVRIPSDTRWFGSGDTVAGSPLTKALRDLAVDSDNWLSTWAKVSYDKVSNLPEKVLGLGPLSHRVQTFGHDPLLGLVLGTWDIMRGTMTAVARDGAIIVMDTAEPLPNPLLAFAKQVIHLLSDAPTHCGLPLPGWLALTTIDSGSFGPNQESFGQVARRMYLNGYDSWHLLTMMSSVAALELVLRGYWGLRMHLDDEWAGDVERAALVSQATGVSDHPRFAAMALAAHGIAAAGNLGKIAVMGGNPLALNYAQWLAFLRAFFRWTGPRLQRPTDVLDRHARANAMAIADGWSGLDFTDPGFPSVDAIGQTNP